MDVVYVIGTGSKWNNNELRYSLRSICKYAKNLGDVYIVGDELPSFLDPSKLTFVQAKDITSDQPYLNVSYKIEKFFDLFQDIDRFLLSSDDHFFLQPVDFDQWPIHYKADRLPDESQINNEKIGDRRYRRLMIDTRRFMEEIGLDTKFYEGHTNKLYTREAYQWLCSPERYDILWDYRFRTEFGICMNSPMAATIMKLHPDYPCVKRKDIKLRHLNQPEDWMAIDAADSFSIYDSAVQTGVGDFLTDLFPKKCKFER